MEIALYILAFILLVALSVFIMHASQSPEDNKEDIIKELESKQLELVNIKVPKLFDTGPFPKFEINVGPQTQALGQRGEKSRYRIVTYKDRKGNTQESWLKIEITAFIVTQIQWKPQL